MDKNQAFSDALSQYMRQNSGGFSGVFAPFGMFDSMGKGGGKGGGGKKDPKDPKSDGKPVYNPNTGAFEVPSKTSAAAPVAAPAPQSAPMAAGGMYSPISMAMMQTPYQQPMGLQPPMLNNYNPNDIMRYLNPLYRGGM